MSLNEAGKKYLRERNSALVFGCHGMVLQLDFSVLLLLLTGFQFVRINLYVNPD